MQSVRDGGAPLPGIRVQAAFPLAAEQHGLWYLQQLSPECGAYHLLFGIEVELKGTALPALADQALHAMLAEHDVLRTALIATPQGPVQQVHGSVRPDVRVKDASGWPDEVLREQARQDSRQPFDLSRPPLWRVHLYRREPARWLVVLVAHHVLLDFWSLGLLLQELAGRLGFSAPPPRPPDGAAYGAHAQRQQDRLNDTQRTAAWLNHWQAHLQGAPSVHGLPLDGQRSTVPSHDGRTLPFSFDVPTSEAIRRAARDLDATPFMVLLAVYAVLLQRFSGEDDLVVAVPVAGRTGRAQHHQLGQFVNTVALRVRPCGETGFDALVQQVRETVVGGLRQGDCPFHWLVQQLAPPRDARHAPLAQLAFAWERLPLLAAFEHFFLADPPPLVTDVPGAQLRPFAVPQQEGQYELQLEMGGERDGAFVGAFKYQPHLFRQETVANMAACFVHLARRLTAKPTVPLASIGLDDAPPTTRALAQGRGADTPWPPDSLLSLIGAWARRTPQAIAVRDATQALTHGALWQRATGIAAALQAHGVRPGDRVGLMLDRHADLVAGVLGIWQAGAAYVPLDPTHPAERVAHMATDADLRALFSERTLQAAWPAGVAVLCREEIASVDAPSAAEVPTGPADTAYILYTSGSTGRPKGVRVGHASVRNFLLGMRDRLQWQDGVCLLAVTTPAFDISMLEMLLPLLVGGEVRMADSESVRDGRLLARWLADAPDGQPVTAMQATPATWRMLIDAGWTGTPGLVALCGGEPLPQPLADALQGRTAALWNLYGPTETTVWSTAARLSPGEAVHLGTPLAHTQLHVLDDAGRPVPPGVLGELWIGGAGLALDYWRQPALTADRFRELPTRPDAGRLYRTGDRVRWNADGHLEHHGRLDFQVKLRGFRIELGEIEATLTRHPGVRDAAVVLHDDGSPRGPQLVAYAVCREGHPLDAADLHRHVQRSLPSPMIPSAFVFLGALPLTPHRKLDRRALPPPTSAVPLAMPSDRVAPRDALEIQLTGLYERLLGISPVGVHDDFFDLGGHSLLAMQLVAEVQRQWGAELRVAQLMQHGSVAALARCLRDHTPSVSSVLVPLGSPPGPAAPPPLWLFHPIGGTVFCYLELSRRLAPGRPVVAVQSPGLAQDGEAEVTVEAMARRYVVEIQAHQPQGPYLLGGWCFGGVVAFEVARKLREGGAPVDRVVLIDTRAPVPANLPDGGDDALLMSWFARDLAMPYGKRLHLPAEDLRSLPAAAMFDAVLQAASAIDVLPVDATADQLARYFEAYLANGIALQGHLPAPQDVPVLLLRARDEPGDHGPALGWEALARGALTVIDVPGDHHSVVQAPQAAEVAALIDRHCPCVEAPRENRPPLLRVMAAA